VRDELGRDRNAALVNNPSAELEVRLSHDGWRNPAQQPRGSLQRVQYRLEDESLIREYWPVMDHMLGDEPRSLELLKNIRDFEITFLQEDGDWTENWPPPVDQSEQYPVILPKAVRYKFNLEGFGEIERLVEVL
jgi:general secretion pathway protein J